MNVVGLTALEIAEQRNDVTPEWLVMFKEILHNIDLPDDLVCPNIVDGEVDEFQDAPESQEHHCLSSLS